MEKWLGILFAFFLGAKAFAEGGSFYEAGRMKSELSQFVNASRPNRSVATLGHKAAYDFIKERFEKIAQDHLQAKVFDHSFIPDTEFAVTNYYNDFNTQVEGKIAPTNPEYKKWKSFTNNAISFVSSFEKTLGQNLILEFKGSKVPGEVIYVGAHYDTITNEHQSLNFTPEVPTQGADDNASAVVALLAVARDLAQHPPERTVRLVAFDFEEIFFLGSYGLAKDLKAAKLSWIAPKEKTLGLFNLEMIGWSHQGKIVKVYARKKDDAGSARDMALAKILLETQKKITPRALSKSSNKSSAGLDVQILQNGFDRSDQWSFWQFGFPGLCISQDWEHDFNEANYHTGHDNVDTLNYAYLAEIAHLTGEAVKALAATGL